MKSWVLSAGSLAFALVIAALTPATADELAETNRTAASKTDAATIATKVRANSDAAAPATTSRAAQTIATFDALDRNGDAQISRTEAGYDRQLSKSFAIIDTNGDGFLSLDEFAARDNS